MPKEPLLNAAIVSLFCELAQRAADSDEPDYQDAESLQLFDFLEDTVRSSSDVAFRVYYTIRHHPTTPHAEAVEAEVINGTRTREAGKHCRDRG